MFKPACQYEFVPVGCRILISLSRSVDPCQLSEEKIMSPVPFRIFEGHAHCIGIISGYRKHRTDESVMQNQKLVDKFIKWSNSRGWTEQISWPRVSL